MQTPLWQSDVAKQGESIGHAGQSPPPQSMPVSLPFAAASVQVAIAHVPVSVAQTPLMH